MGDTILVADHGTWAEVTLNRPDRLNSFDDAMHHALRAALEGARGKARRAPDRRRAGPSARARISPTGIPCGWTARPTWARRSAPAGRRSSG